MTMVADISGPTRPVLRWFGGKWRLAPWIIGHFPPHRTYVEPFGGAGSVLLRKPRAYAEIWNDLDGDAVNLFRVLRDPGGGARLIELLRLTPFARAEFEAAYDPIEDPVERARRLIVHSFMGFAAQAHRKARTGFRSNSNRSHTTPAHDWSNYPSCLVAVIERLQGVVIEDRDALQVMRQHDTDSTLHYVDPPYVWSTRGRYDAQRRYNYEMDEAAHAGLLDALKTLSGAVVLSGYPHPLYDAALPEWHRIERDAFADGAKPRIEVLWLNPRCQSFLQKTLPFGGAA